MEQTKALRDVIAERKRQIDKEGWTADHDDFHMDGSLAKAAACYAMSGAADDTQRRQMRDIEGDHTLAFFLRNIWPEDWAFKWWKPKNRRRDLVRAGALILAEIERLDRAAALAGEVG